MVRDTLTAVTAFGRGRATTGVRTSAAIGSVALPATTAYLGVCALVLVAPFELTRPLVRARLQSISSLEAAVLVVLVAWFAAMAWSWQWPQWRTPLTAPWATLLAAMGTAALAAPVARTNALHMTGRLTVAFSLYLLAVNAITTTARLHRSLVLAVVAGVVVGVLAILEYLQLGAVLAWLTAFRPGIAVVGAQLRAGGPLQYPTIASMYLEITFAFGIGLLMATVDTRQRTLTAALFVALLVIAEGIVLTLTRAGLATMATSIAGAALWRGRRHGLDGAVRLIAALAILIAVLFVASRSTQSLWLRMTSEGQEVWYRSAIRAPDEIALTSGVPLDVPVRVTNTGRLTWDSDADPPFYLSYHWLELDTDRVVAFEGARTVFGEPVEPGATAAVQATVWPPEQAGRYRLAWDVVQEGRLWFSTEPGATLTLSQAVVSGPAATPDASASASTRRLMPRPRERPGRLRLWQAAGRMFAAHPLLGVGPDNFRLLYGAYAGLPNPDPRMHSNNMYIEVLTGSGVVGALALGWLCWRIVQRLASRMRRAAADRDLTADVGVVLAVVAIGVHGTVDSFLGFTPTYLLMALTLGLAVRRAPGAEA